ncbi:MAG: glutathione S-transferase [Pseudomonadota bacterium]
MQRPILYSFRRCPYAMRARSALIISGIELDHREVELRDKPAEMLTASPKGSVPVLVLHDGSVIDESWYIMLWALRTQGTHHWLGENECHVTATLPLLQENDGTFKQALDRYKYPERFPEHPQRFYREQGETFLQRLETRLAETPYLLGDTFSIADAALLPFIRQFAAVDSAWFSTAPYPKSRAWLTRYTESEMFAKVMQKFPVWKASPK